MFYIMAWSLEEDEVGQAGGKDFIPQFLDQRKKPKIRISDFDNASSTSFAKKHSVEQFPIDNAGYLLCAVSKTSLKNGLKNTDYPTLFTTTGAQISVLFQSYSANSTQRNAFKLAKAKAKAKSGGRTKFSLTEFSIKDLLTGVAEGKMSQFRLDGYAMVVAKSNWFDPTVKGQTKLMGDGTVSGATIAQFGM